MNFALIVAQNERCAIARSYTWTILPVVSRFTLTPLQGASLRGDRFPGSKPWAESCSPFGANNP
jgi:hypothetical protein